VNPSYPNEPVIPDAIPPIMDYDRSQGTAVIGGYVYRGRRDLTLLGRYVFGDLSSGLFVGSENTTGSWVWTRVAFRCGGDCPSSNFGLLYSFYEDHDGDVYAIGTGGIFRISERAICGLPSGNSTLPPSPSSEPPTQSPSVSPSPETGLSATSDVTGSITIGTTESTSTTSSTSLPVGTDNHQSGASLHSAVSVFVLLCAAIVLVLLA